MRTIRKAVLAALGCVAMIRVAADSAEIADIAARIDYGFHAEEPAVIAGALAALERLPERDPSVRYYRALASWRLAGLERDPARARALLGTCADSAPTDGEGNAAAEAWILLGACAGALARAEPARGLLQQRRAEQALERAAAIDAANPRLPLVRALAERDAGRGGSTAATVALEASVAAFDARGSDGARADWGEAEALALLAERRLADGRRQAARDLVERALLIAPDYRFAQRLRERIATAR